MANREGGNAMPYGPKGQWRPAETGACAVHVMKVATGQIEETYARDQTADHVAASRRASKPAKARAANQTPERRKQIAATAAAARWGSQ